MIDWKFATLWEWYRQGKSFKCLETYLSQC